MNCLVVTRLYLSRFPGITSSYLLRPHPSCEGSSTLIAGLVFHVVFDADLALITLPPTEFRPLLWPHVSVLSGLCLASVQGVRISYLSVLQ